MCLFFSVVIPCDDILLFLGHKETDKPKKKKYIIVFRNADDEKNIYRWAASLSLVVGPVFSLRELSTEYIYEFSF